MAPVATPRRFRFSILYWTWWSIIEAAICGLALAAKVAIAIKDRPNVLLAIGALITTIASSTIIALVLSLCVSFVLMWLKERAPGAHGFHPRTIPIAFAAGVLLAFGLWLYGNMTGAPL